MVERPPVIRHTSPSAGPQHSGRCRSYYREWALVAGIDAAGYRTRDRSDPTACHPLDQNGLEERHSFPMRRPGQPAGLRLALHCKWHSEELGGFRRVESRLRWHASQTPILPASSLGARNLTIPSEDIPWNPMKTFRGKGMGFCRRVRAGGSEKFHRAGGADALLDEPLCKTT